MLYRVSFLKKIGSIVLVIYCFVLLEISLPSTLLNRNILKKPIIHEMNFANFSLSYRYFMMPDLSLCDGSRNHTPLLVATVLTTAKRYEMRQAIRETWASPKEFHAVKTGRILVYFILSAPTTVHELYMLRREQRIHNDLIVTDLPESYNNLVFKVYASMVFHQQYCPMARFLMKVDDDVSVHLDRMVELWKMDTKADMSLYCRVWPKSRPQRDPENKWFVPEQMWPERHFPPYCNGPMYVMGKKAGQILLDQAQIFLPMTIEDLFYTGILVDSTGIRRVNWGKNMMYRSKEFFRGRIACSATEKPILFSVHSLSQPELMRKGFQILKNYECRFAGSAAKPHNKTNL
ncbi:Hexosyltransferase [Trichostrongylus colubriformis]|uniref:Hexosyltransferase n=1 Tax=Trichostrongylus colubriformis TaxID=6319 RepID=A0AAN8F4L3_TRICO